MKNLIVRALYDAIVKVNNQVPTTKKEIVEVTIEDVQPLDLLKFMQDNNIPENASFSTTHSEYAIGTTVNPCLYYYVDVKTTEKEKTDFIKNRFTSVAWKFVYDLLTNNGYKRVGFNSGLLKNFKDTTVYDMYIAKDFDRLVEYYSMPFQKISDYEKETI
jgi:hypothetical protein